MKLRMTLYILLVFSPHNFANSTLGKKEILLNNVSVEVVRLTYPAGSESGVHTHIHPNRVVHFIKGGKLSLISNDSLQTNKVINVPDGKTLFFPATTHNVKNIGNTEIVIL
jgi:quercetin dioxygenase-like cupin family protein